MKTNRWLFAILCGEAGLVLLNIYPLCFLPSPMIIAGIVVLLYRTAFLWALGTEQRFVSTIYGVFNSIIVLRNAFLLSMMAIYLSSHGTRLSKSGDLYVGDSAISKFGLAVLLYATALRTLGAVWSFFFASKGRLDRVSVWPSAGLAAPIVLPAAYVLILSGPQGMFMFLLYDLILFYKFQIFF